MTELSFVDTNVFVYARDESDPAKNVIALDLVSTLWRSGYGRISVQVLSEYYAVLVGKYGVADDLIGADLEALLSWDPLPIDAEVLKQALVVRRHYKLSWWDCLIIAAALRLGCKKIYSEDLSDGGSYLGAVVVNPFKP